MSKDIQKVLVTGGSGFIGTHLVQYLLDHGWVVLNVDLNPPLLSEHAGYWKRVDLLDSPSVRATVQAFSPDFIVHLAARTDLDETQNLNGYAVNIQGVQYLLDAIKQTPSVRRAILTSSMLVCRLGYRPCADDDYAPNTLYGESKVLTEKIIRKAALDCEWAIVRPATIWGPHHHRLRTGFFRALMKGYYFHPGKEECKKSYGYVGNSVFQISTLLEAPRDKVQSRVFNVADPPIELGQWVNECSQKLTGKKMRVVPYWAMKMAAAIGDQFVKLGIKNFPISTFRLDNMRTENIVDIHPILGLTGPLPWTTSQGIDETVAWLKSSRSDNS